MEFELILPPERKIHSVFHVSLLGPVAIILMVYVVVIDSKGNAYYYY